MRISTPIGTAQTALAYGADDLDGTVRHELIYHDAGATTPEVLSVEDICRLITEGHGGRIWAESEPGAGSTFSVLLPLDPRKTKAVAGRS